MRLYLPIIALFLFAQNTSVSAQISIIYDEPATICMPSAEICEGALQFPFQIVAEDPFNTTVSYQLRLFNDEEIDDIFGFLSGTYPNFSIDGFYPEGIHSLVIEVSDLGGELSSEIVPFEVKDCDGPELNCVNGILVELFPLPPGIDFDGDGDEDTFGLGLSGSDFVVESPDCNDPVTYSINRLGTTPAFDQEILYITDCCEPSTQVIEIFAYDNTFNPELLQPDGSIGGPNFSRCETFLFIQDSAFNPCDCASFVLVEGSIATVEAEPMPDVELLIEGLVSTESITNEEGIYTAELSVFINSATSVSLSPLKDDDILNGVTTFDLIKITQHILGIQALPSPYLMIAADVNRSQSISTLDLIELQKLILSIEQEFANNTSWRFIDANYAFPDPTNPWLESFPESIELPLSDDFLGGNNFIGVKVGDMNLNANLGN